MRRIASLLLTLPAFVAPAFAADPIVDIAAGAVHACAVSNAHVLYCWGDNTWGELGDGTTVLRGAPVRALLPEGAVAVAASRGYPAHTCAVTANGGAKCWGANDSGQLGDGTTTQRAAPDPVNGLDAGVAAVAAGVRFSCALLASGDVKCWGRNDHGQLGDGTIVQRLTPVAVAGVNDAIALSAGREHACAIRAAGAVTCWGANESGQLGDGTTTDRHTPVDVVGLPGPAISIAAGGAPYEYYLDHYFQPIWVGGGETCASTSGRVGLCWGMVESARTPVATLVPVAGDIGAVNPGIGQLVFPTPHLSLWIWHTCAIRDGEAVCWGYVPTRGAQWIRTDPGPIPGVASNVVAVAAGESFDCVLTARGAVQCWSRSEDPHYLAFGDVPPRLSAISTRALVRSGDAVAIAGFAIDGTAPKTVLVRARGPSLGVAGTLANPLLTLVPPAGAPLVNDDWASAANAGLLIASGLQPGDARESAILATLDPGAYTAILDGAGGATGIGIVEVYELDFPQAPMIALSTRGFVSAGDGAMIAGFAIDGPAPKTVVVRARGPTLGLVRALADPQLVLVDAAGGMIVNDDWGSAANAGELAATGLAPGDAKEAAIMATLPPGIYTAVASGVGGISGLAIVEVYAH